MSKMNEDQTARYHDFLDYINHLKLDDMATMSSFVMAYYNKWLSLKEDDPEYTLSYLKYAKVVSKFGPCFIYYYEMMQDPTYVPKVLS